jgi:hypothetical protein
VVTVGALWLFAKILGTPVRNEILDLFDKC